MFSLIYQKKPSVSPCHTETNTAKLKIAFNYAWAYFDAAGSHCDNDFLEHCDTYVRLLINGKKVFQSKTVHSQNFAQIYQTYVSDEPISKNSEIIIEMWDYDRFSPDDFMSSWILNPERDFGSGGTMLYDNRNKDGKLEFKIACGIQRCYDL